MKHSKWEIKEQLKDLGSYRAEVEAERVTLDDERRALVEQIDRLERQANDKDTRLAGIARASA